MRHLLDAATSAIPWVGVLCILVTIFLTLLSFGLVIPATPLRGWGLPNYQSNWGAGVTLQQVRRPKSALLHDVVDPSLLTSSWVVPAPALAAYRGVWAVYFILTLTLPTAAGYDNDPARNYLRFFTHWTITATALLGLWGPAVFLVDRTALGRVSARAGARVASRSLLPSAALVRFNLPTHAPPRESSSSRVAKRPPCGPPPWTSPRFRSSGERETRRSPRMRSVGLGKRRGQGTWRAGEERGSCRGTERAWMQRIAGVRPADSPLRRRPSQ